MLPEWCNDIARRGEEDKSCYRRELTQYEFERVKKVHRVLEIPQLIKIMRRIYGT
jgi:hypothetical protein